FRKARNAGSKINSSHQELTPFYDVERNALYFSSDRPGGLGGLDLYKATGEANKWSGVTNAGTPYNSGADDLYMSLSTTGQEGFLVSNRKGGNALKNQTCCDD